MNELESQVQTRGNGDWGTPKSFVSQFSNSNLKFGPKHDSVPTLPLWRRLTRLLNPKEAIMRVRKMTSGSANWIRSPNRPWKLAESHIWGQAQKYVIWGKQIWGALHICGIFKGATKTQQVDRFQISMYPSYNFSPLSISMFVIAIYLNNILRTRWRVSFNIK